MKKVALVLSILTVLVLTVAVFSVWGVFAEEEAPKLTATVPFDVPVEEETAVTTAKKAEYEDVASKFLNISSDLEKTFNASFVERLKTHFNQIYPVLAERWNYGIMYDVNYDIGELEGAAAYQMGTSNPLVMLICLIPSHFKSNPNDMHTLTHEMTHALQVYKDSKYGAANTANGGSWITEGIADVSRYMYDNRFSLPSFASNQKYTDSYRVTARFFLWIDQNVEDTFVEQFHDALKCEAYNQNFFVKITGKTVDELWQMYAASDHKVVRP